MGHKKFFQLALLCWFLTACEETTPPGTVAQVNGEPISLHSVQALMDSRTGALGIAPKPSVAEMQERYAEATRIMVVHTLVRQELQAKGLAVDDAELDAAIAQIKSDYGEAGLEEFLADASLREDEWRQLVRDYLSLAKFSQRILDPTIRIDRDELRQWYKEHEAQFKKPETWRVCFKGGESREELEQWCRGWLEDPGRQEGSQCSSVLPQEVPDPWQTDFKKIAPGKCGKITKDAGQWHTIALLRKDAAKTVKLSEAYPVVERAIISEKRLAAFDNWLKEKLTQANVKAMPGLFPAGEKKAADDGQ